MTLRTNPNLALAWALLSLVPLCPFFGISTPLAYATSSDLSQLLKERRDEILSLEAVLPMTSSSDAPAFRERIANLRKENEQTQKQLDEILRNPEPQTPVAKAGTREIAHQAPQAPQPSLEKSKTTPSGASAAREFGPQVDTPPREAKTSLVKAPPKAAVQGPTIEEMGVPKPGYESSPPNPTPTDLKQQQELAVRHYNEVHAQVSANKKELREVESTLRKTTAEMDRRESFIENAKADLGSNDPNVIQTKLPTKTPQEIATLTAKIEAEGKAVEALQSKIEDYEDRRDALNEKLAPLTAERRVAKALVLAAIKAADNQILLSGPERQIAVHLSEGRSVAATPILTTVAPPAPLSEQPSPSQAASVGSGSTFTSAQNSISNFREQFLGVPLNKPKPAEPSGPLPQTRAQNVPVGPIPSNIQPIRSAVKDANGMEIPVAPVTSSLTAGQALPSSSIPGRPGYVSGNMGVGSGYVGSGYSGGGYSSGYSSATQYPNSSYGGGYGGGYGGTYGNTAMQMGTQMLGMPYGMSNYVGPSNDPCATAKRLDHGCAGVQSAIQSSQIAAMMLPMFGQMAVQSGGAAAQATLMQTGVTPANAYNAQAAVAERGGHTQMALGGVNAAITGGLLMKASSLDAQANQIRAQGGQVGKAQTGSKAETELKPGVDGFLNPGGIAGKIVQRWQLNAHAGITARVLNAKDKDAIARRKKEVAEHEKIASQRAQEVADQAASELRATSMQAKMAALINGFMAVTQLQAARQAYATAKQLRAAAAYMKGAGYATPPGIGPQSGGVTVGTESGAVAQVGSRTQEATAAPVVEATPTPGTDTLGNGFPTGPLPTGVPDPGPAPTDEPPQAPVAGSGGGGGAPGSGGAGTAAASNPPDPTAQQMENYVSGGYTSDGQGGGRGGGGGGGSSSGQSSGLGNLAGLGKEMKMGNKSILTSTPGNGPFYNSDVSLFEMISATMNRQGPALASKL